MSGFELAPADGGCTVALPPGQTVLGRGPLLGITDKRVSRRHAILEVVGDQLRIKPVHVNPCFYQSPENSNLLPLETDEWHSLSPGDSFSLLIDKYVFKVLSPRSDMESTLRKNSKIADETANTSSSSGYPTKMSCESSLTEVTSCSNNNIQVKVHSLLERTAEIPKNKTSSKSSPFSVNCKENEELKPVGRKRMLPSWMLQGDLMVQSLSTPVTKRGGGVTRGRGKSSMEQSRANGEERKRSSSEEHSGDFKEIKQDQIKKCKTTEEETMISPIKGNDASRISLTRAVGKVEENESKTQSQGIESSVEKSDCQLHSKKSDHRLDAESQLSTEANKMNERETTEKIIHSASQQTHQDMPSCSHVSLAETRAFDLNEDPKAEDFNSARSMDAQKASNQSKQKRTPCMYGTDCYRKNPVHFQQFSHPGDSDYHEVEVISQDDDDDRPECPYGITCYRKNPQHKLEYKHTAPPEVETRRTRGKTTKRGESVLEEDRENYDEPNEYDLNDSFIDDEEKEEYDPTDEDSDWEPDPEDKNNEDVETLLKEAQKFIKTKK
ncbi:aprataxin and PNK-like factor [Carettochelys insculpta]|uniref:aprataxin and PNK-like factor n=1 Tax=Carettochelys insculpta TaxID=44489 RepID=UPI003EBB0631